VGNINQGRYDHLLRRTTAQVGPGSKVGNALEDLFPTLDVENAPMELLRASGWVFGTGFLAEVPSAGNNAAIALFNPADSGHLVVCTTININGPSAVDVMIGPIFTALASVNLPGAQRDTRAGAIAQTVARLQSDENATSSAFLRIPIVANVNTQLTDIDGYYVLAPGSGMQVFANTVDITIRAGFLWRERVAEPEELDF